MVYEFLYTTHPKQLNVKGIYIDCESHGKAYSILIGGLLNPATFVYSVTEKRRII